MPLTIWNQESGYSFGSIEERTQFTQETGLVLPTTGSLSGVSFSIISGSLPPGLRLFGNKIIGTPFEVARPTEFKFCIRAKSSAGISDRTFLMNIGGSDEPAILTPPGDLPVGPNRLYFALDESYIDFQLTAVDFDTATGQKLTFFIEEDGGELPPGLTLSDTGKLSGFIEPAYAIRITDGNGTYDDGLFDGVAYDFGVRSSNGYDSFIYDQIFFDYSTPTNPPKRLNRNYEFVVSVSDGDTVAREKYRIFVVADNYLRADNTTLPSSTGLYSADGTFMRAAVWKTPEYLGVYRANNYITLMLDTYKVSETEIVIFSLDADTAWSANTIYRLGDKILYQGKTFFCQTAHTSSSSINLSYWKLQTLPPGVQFDIATAEVFGTVPYQPAITKRYSFSVTANTFSPNIRDTAVSTRIFSIDIIGEIDSTINWLTDSALGTVPANYVSNLQIQAETTVEGAQLVYSIESGRLPPGLTLNPDGEIVGKVNQYGDETKPGLTRFYEEPPTPSITEKIFTTFDGGDTTVDRSYTFVARARDQFEFSSITREFTIDVSTPNNKLYSNLTVRPFLPLDQRARFKSFVTNNIVFTPESIYRPNDPDFGIQTQLKMIAYAGIETTEAAKYISAMGLNHKKKRFKFGSINKAYAIYPGTNNVVYEVVYIEIIDPLEPNNLKLNSQIKNVVPDLRTVRVDSSNNTWSRDTDILNITSDPFGRRPDPRITIDQTDFNASDLTPTSIYPSSITNWQNDIKNWQDDSGNGLATERNYLPLWMRSIQPGTKRELGFTLAAPICFCKPGYADDIILNIKNNGFNFKQLDYTVDRYTIDAVAGYTNDKYLVFKTDRNTIT
jgi:hypothetical protein